jgi:carbonic anhydrase
VSSPPIDLAPAERGERGDLALAYHLSAATFTDVGRTLSVALAPGGVLTYQGRRHEFAELHFHSPSEHTFDGRHADLEAHFVHAAPDFSLTVVGVLFAAAPGTHPIDPFVSTFPAEPLGAISTERLVDAQRLMPLRSPRYRYTGSLTTPPCSEGVSWVVMQETQPIGEAALAAFRERYVPNNRPTQPLNERTVILG